MATDDWDAWRHHVLKSIDRIEQKLNDLVDETSQAAKSTERELALLKLKAGLWGLTAGGLMTLLMILINLLTKKGGP